MAACSYIGRVGGLAIALGVGSALLGGTAVGWADDAGTAPSADRSGLTQSSTAAGAASSVGTRGRASTAGSRKSESPRRVATGVPRRGQTSDALPPESESGSTASGRRAHSDIPVELPDLQSAAVFARSDAQSPVQALPAVEILAATPADPAEAVKSTPSVVAANQTVSLAADLSAAPVAALPAPAAAPAPMVSALSASATASADPFAGGNTVVPVTTPLDWATLAFARRSPAAATAPLPIILGPSGVPIPSVKYGETVMSYYIPDGIPGTQQLVFTPEGLYPITGVKSLPLNTSVDQGIQILSDVLTPLPAGTPVTVFGYSQSAIIESLLQGGYTVEVDGQDVKFVVPEGLTDSINFVFVGNEMNPNGGFLSRFSGRDMPLFSLPSLGIPFYGPTPGGPLPPTGQEYVTTNYQREYDGFSDFPRYPMNFLSVLNAALGIAYVHVQYTPTISQEQCAQKAFCLLKTQVEAASPLPSTSASQQYFFIPTENLPLLQPLRGIPFIGNPLADLIQPALKVIVDFGYADPAHGFTTGTQPNANELTPFGVTPPWGPVYREAFTKFIKGIGQGITDFIADFGPNGSVAKEIAAFAQTNLGQLGVGASGGFIARVQNVISSVSNALSRSIAGLYAPLLPTADVITAIALSLPAYSLNLFLYGMEKVLSGNVVGGLIDAFGLPIAANVGLITMAGLVAAGVWTGSVLEYT